MTDESHIFALKQAIGADAVDLVKEMVDALGMDFNAAAEFINNEYVKFAEATKGTILEGKDGYRIFNSVIRKSRWPGCDGATTADMHCAFVVLRVIITTGGISEEEFRRHTGEKYDKMHAILNEVFQFGEDELQTLISNEELHVPRLKTMITLKWEGMPFDTPPKED